jgi:CRP-like cAMP-binding protein
VASSSTSVKQAGQQIITQKIVVLGTGNFLALEDIARISPHSYTVKCVSSVGTLILMEVEKFHSVIRHIPNGFSEITRLNKTKWRSYFDKMTILEEQKN